MTLVQESTRIRRANRLEPNFTVHDRGGTEDLVSLVRHELPRRCDEDARSGSQNLSGDLLSRGE